MPQRLCRVASSSLGSQIFPSLESIPEPPLRGEGLQAQDAQECRQTTAQPRLQTVIHSLSSTFMAQEVLHQKFPIQSQNTALILY